MERRVDVPGPTLTSGAGSPRRSLHHRLHRNNKRHFSVQPAQPKQQQQKKRNIRKKKKTTYPSVMAAFVIRCENEQWTAFYFVSV